MADGILSEAMQNPEASAEHGLSQPIHPGLEGTPGDQLPYFRHKGIKVKFWDIESALATCENISQAAVVFSEDQEGSRRLVAYLITNGPFSQMNVVNELMTKVKPYMIPAHWICLKSFPLKSNGEIDRVALHESIDAEAPADEFLAPGNEMEIKLAGIIQNLLGVGSISVRDNFFKLGGGSLQALKVIAAIRRELAIDLDVKYFFVYPTIAELAGYLLLLSGDNALYAGQNANDNSNDKAQKWSFHHNQSIIPIKPGDGKMPLYIVCGGGGTAFTFEKFANMLDDNQPVYGFQQPSDINQLAAFPSTIEEIAARYVEELLLVDPDGPYALSGHCIGGVIALEMARKLQSMGKTIRLLAMFDVILSKKEMPEQASINNFYKIPRILKNTAAKVRLKLHFETFLLTRFPKDAIEYKFNSFKSFVNKFFPFQEENQELVVFKKFEEKFETAFENYQVKRYDGKILVFYARDHYHFLDKDRNIRFKKYPLEEATKNRWMEYGDTVAIYEIDGGHSTMFEPFYSNDFAKVLQQHLNECKTGGIFNVNYAKYIDLQKDAGQQKHF